MDNSEYTRKRQQLEENYYQEKKEIQRQLQETEAKVLQFRRETEQLVDKVRYFTKNDNWNKQAFYNKMHTRDDNIQRTGRRYSQYLEEKQQDLTKTYIKGQEQLEVARKKQSE